MTGAAEAFIQVANATAAIVEKAPPYITYHVHGVYHAFNSDTSVDRTVTVRTYDGDAVVHDDATGKDELRPPFPAPPTFDALASFSIHARVGAHTGPQNDADVRVYNVKPLRYAPPAVRSDVVARAVRGYVVSYAGDSPQGGHLHLEKSDRFKFGSYWWRDVWYDPATMVATRIVYAGENDSVIDARYTTVNGVWLLQSLTLESTAHAPLWLGRTKLSFTGEYRDFSFSTVAPDSRLVPVPSSSPAASPAGSAT
jgi:hypothetical protein